MSSISTVKYLSQQKQLPDKKLAAEWKQIDKLYHEKINPYGVVQMVSVIVHNLADKKKAVEFLEQIKGKVKQCDEAAWYCRKLQGLLYLEHLQDLEATKIIIDDLKESMKPHCSDSTIVDLVAQEILYQKIKNVKLINKQNVK